MNLLNSSIPITFNQLYLNGAYSSPDSSESFSVLNPKDNTLVADGIPVAGDSDVDNDVRFAEVAFRGPWSKFSAAERSACFHRLASLLEEKLPEILRLDSLTTGNPVSLIPTREKNYIQNCLLYYGEITVGFC
jgi:aldehyde dehydrogenase (NAD+)/retinal dehydrogenase